MYAAPPPACRERHKARIDEGKELSRKQSITLSKAYAQVHPGQEFYRAERHLPTNYVV